MSQNPDQAPLSDIERSILNQIQSDFPIEKRPYHVLGRRLGLSEEEVLSAVRDMRAKGIIRRIGGSFSSSRLGYASTLCAARVPKEKVEEFARFVNRYEGVTHNYRRNHDVNVWFTFIAPSMEEIEQRLAEIAQATGITEIYNLPAEKTFKIKVDFRFEE
ncbi:MAG: Lrp/AsnC family transcriptional regulator [Pseudomonadota bacterium]